jgi:hypothetical protein
MPRRQPLPQRRRHQKRLFTITFQEILGHPRSVLNSPDGTLCATASRRSRSRGRTSASWGMVAFEDCGDRVDLLQLTRRDGDHKIVGGVV